MEVIICDYCGKEIEKEGCYVVWGYYKFSHLHKQCRGKLHQYMEEHRVKALDEVERK